MDGREEIFPHKTIVSASELKADPIDSIRQDIIYLTDEFLAVWENSENTVRVRLFNIVQKKTVEVLVLDKSTPLSIQSKEYTLQLNCLQHQRGNLRLINHLTGFLYLYLHRDKINLAQLAGFQDVLVLPNCEYLVAWKIKHSPVAGLPVENKPEERWDKLDSTVRADICCCGSCGGC